MTICRKGLTSGGIKGVDINGAEYWVYREAGTKFTRIERELSCHLASEDERHKVYSAFLDNLRLAQGHRELLRDRGFPDDAIDMYQYRSNYVDRRRESKQEILERVKALYPETNLLHVPGFVWRKNTISWTGIEGTFIPVRNIHHQIVALKIRTDDRKYPKYLTFSSRKYAGPGPGANCHAPMGRCWYATDAVWVTEGEIKADLSQFLLEKPVLSIPGVSQWSEIFPVLKEIGASKVRIAFDADAWTNRTVAHEMAKFYRELKLQGYDTGIVTW